LRNGESTRSVGLFHAAAQGSLTLHSGYAHTGQQSTAFAQQDQRARQIVRRLGHHVRNIVHDEQGCLLFVHVLVCIVDGLDVRSARARDQQGIDRVQLCAQNGGEVGSLAEAEQIFAQVPGTI